MKTIIIFGAALLFLIIAFYSCQPAVSEVTIPNRKILESAIAVDTAAIPHNQFGDAVRYGRELMLKTAYYIGPNGINGKYLGNKMNCTNCHQQAGTKSFSFSLMMSQADYPQYRAREGKVLSLAERVNNCIMRPHNGKPLPLDSKEMIAFLSYLKWINSFVKNDSPLKGMKNLSVNFPATPASPNRGKILYEANCSRCHGSDGAGQLRSDEVTYVYPPLWGSNAYQAGSSMHRVIKQAQWLKANMPYDKAKPDNPFLTDQQALDIAAFVNDDKQHHRPDVKVNKDYPHPEDKAIDYDRGPYIDSFSIAQHKFGPFSPIVDYWKANGLHASF